MYSDTANRSHIMLRARRKLNNLKCQRCRLDKQKVRRLAFDYVDLQSNISRHSVCPFPELGLVQDATDVSIMTTSAARILE